MIFIKFTFQIHIFGQLIYFNISPNLWFLQKSINSLFLKAFNNNMRNILKISTKVYNYFIKYLVNFNCVLENFISCLNAMVMLNWYLILDDNNHFFNTSDMVSNLQNCKTNLHRIWTKFKHREYNLSTTLKLWCNFKWRNTQNNISIN